MIRKLILSNYCKFYVYFVDLFQLTVFSGENRLEKLRHQGSSQNSIACTRKL